MSLHELISEDITMQPSQRPIKNILILNRGEITVRILQSIHELPQPVITHALYTASDTTHITLGRPHNSIEIPSPAVYTEIDAILQLIEQHNIDAVHPGYGFLSESADFARRCEEIGVLVVGPGSRVLERTGDKLKAKQLAIDCGVPVLKAMTQPALSLADVRRFVDAVGMPVMVKAVDGGGGRGIRLVTKQGDLQDAVERCQAESMSGTVFAEQAAVAGYKHIEVQIIGDGKGEVRHLWERDCSVQRRFQKIVEVAPAPLQDRRLMAEVITSAISMARTLRYQGLGTWEFLVNVRQRKYFFLEINPRIQVEHTISESVAGIDLVREQLLIAQGLDGAWDGLPTEADAQRHPGKYSIQFRLCAEDPAKDFALSVGQVTHIMLPTGNGVRVDSHLHRAGHVGSDFDNMMAKIIVTAGTWEQTLSKASRALAEVDVQGVKTNIDLLRAVAADETFAAGAADTSWLQNVLENLVTKGRDLGQRIDSVTHKLPSVVESEASMNSSSGGNAPLKKGDAWTLRLEGQGEKTEASHLLIEKIGRNEFPEALVADILFTAPGQQSTKLRATLQSTNASAASTASKHRRGDVNNTSHVILPMSGKLVEILVQEGDEVKEDEVIAFVKQMKMELEVRSPRAGIVAWAIELEDEDGDDVSEGVLLVELRQAGVVESSMKSKL